MGRLQTLVTLPKRILLQGWAGDQNNEDINGEYVYGTFRTSPEGPDLDGYIRQNAYPFAYIYFNIPSNRWDHVSDDSGWINFSTNPNVLPLNGWIGYNSQGPAGTITILEDISAKTNKISIKKQNLTKLNSSNFFNEQESTYIFRSATNNTLAQIFNPNQFEAYADSLSLYDINFNPLSLNNGGGSTLFTDGSSWLYDDFITNADSYVIPANTILVFGTEINFDINVNGGAIIQKFRGGKLIIEGGESFIFSSPSINNSRLINFNTECRVGNDYYPTAADPFEIPFNVQLPKKPKKITVKLNAISADDAGYMLIVLKNPSGKVSTVLFLNKTSGLPYSLQHVNAIINDDYPNKIFSDLNNFPIYDTTVYGKPNTTITSPPCFEDADHGQTETNVVLVRDGGCNFEIGTYDICNSATLIVEGFTLVGPSPLRRFYYTKLNKLIDEDYNGTWKIYCWNDWSSDPSDVQNIIYEGVDLIFTT